MRNSFVGVVNIEITSADVELLLADINGSGVYCQHVQFVDSLTVRLDIRRSDINRVKTHIAKRGATLRIIRKTGLYWQLRRLLKRPLLISGIVVMLLLVYWVPSKVLFITVEGNSNTPARYIIEQANLCGITFGASRREVRSEKMKNRLLEAVPSLQWAGINTKGCTAIISVKERVAEESQKEYPQVSSIVAARDGIIESCTTQRGNQLCQPGQAVRSGDILISAYTDCGIKINATRAEGEVYAQTKHELTVLTPADYQQDGNAAHVEKKYGIIIGKKRINFYKGSGILGAGCDKICKEYYLKLPGGFQLPVAFVVTTISVCDESTVLTAAEVAETTVHDYAQQYLLTQMISGKILQDVSKIQYDDDVCMLQGMYICSEMIGRVQNEETIGNYGKDYGENR